MCDDTVLQSGHTVAAVFPSDALLPPPFCGQTRLDTQAPSVPQQVSPAVHILVQLCWHFHVAWFAGQFFHCGQETWQTSGGVDAAAVVPDVAPFAVAQDAILDVTPVPQVDWAHSRAGGVPALCVLCVCDVC